MENRMEDLSGDLPFGTFALTPARGWLRERMTVLPAGRFGRTCASLIRRLLTWRQPGIFDVEVFPTINARLYPATNVCEKRVFMNTRYFDAQERNYLDEVIRISTSDPLVFLDVGANVGLYGLSVVSSARSYGREARVICIEPDDTTRARLINNVAFSGASELFTIENCGVGPIRGRGSITVHPDNRGEHRIVTTNGEAIGSIEIKPLQDICAEHGITRIDALKIDVEGLDFDVLKSFFDAAAVSLYPQVIIAERDNQKRPSNIVVMCEARGYSLVKQTSLNFILARVD